MEKTWQARAVTVRKLPPKMDEKGAQVFLRELEECLNGRRPAVVLDCSKVRGLGRDQLRLMLCCLEEAMKRNGDVRLAAVSRETRAVLDDSGVGRLFKSYETSADATASFQRPAGYGIGPVYASSSPPVQPARNAA
jgi:anti-sigma B factor antagonist